MERLFITFNISENKIVIDDRFYSFADEGELSPNSRKTVSRIGFLLHKFNICVPNIY